MNIIEGASARGVPSFFLQYFKEHFSQPGGRVPFRVLRFIVSQVDFVDYGRLGSVEASFPVALGFSIV